MSAIVCRLIGGDADVALTVQQRTCVADVIDARWSSAFAGWFCLSLVMACSLIYVGLWASKVKSALPCRGGAGPAGGDSADLYWTGSAPLISAGVRPLAVGVVELLIVRSDDIVSVFYGAIRRKTAF